MALDNEEKKKKKTVTEQKEIGLVQDPKPTPAWITFSIPCGILEAIYIPDEVWGRD